MKAEDLFLGGLLVSAVAGIIHWAYRDLTAPPKQPTKEDIQQAWEEHMRRVEYEQNWLAEDGYP